MKTTPWRTVLPVEETGRFTREQLDTAVSVVMERRRAHAARWPMVLREQGPGWGVRPPEQPAAAMPERELEPYVRPRRGRGRRRPEADR